jgi:dihydroorotase
MHMYFLKNATVINEGKSEIKHVLIKGEFIAKIVDKDASIVLPENCEQLDLKGMWLLPGLIDDQVHFRDPGLTQKADLTSESRAAVAGGITSYMDMPNTIPNALTQAILEDKYKMASNKSLANFSFYMGVSNSNVGEVLKTNPKTICGIKIFLGASTGNMLVDSEATLETLFAQAPTLIAVHCEDEQTIQRNLKEARIKYKDEIPLDLHPKIRSHEACMKSSLYAVNLARKHTTRLHVLHLSTAEETSLFDNHVPLEKKKITAEVCVHHLWFDSEAYKERGSLIKWNPAIKDRKDADTLMQALIDDKLDVVATDHAPHLLSEKKNTYLKAPSGAPMVQHSLNAMLEMAKNKKISKEKVVEKMCHNPAVLFSIEKRGFLKEGYYADLTVVDPNTRWTVNKNNILYKCGWSPMEGITFNTKVKKTFVNGHLVYNDGVFDDSKKGKRLIFNR